MTFEQADLGFDNSCPTRDGFDDGDPPGFQPVRSVSAEKAGDAPRVRIYPDTERAMRARSCDQTICETH